MRRTAQALEGRAAVAAAPPESGQRYTILALGFAKWWGSDARALAQSFKRLGHNLVDMDEEDFVPLQWEGAVPRLIRRLAQGSWVKDYNRAVMRRARSSCHDFVVVYKGALIEPETLDKLRALG